MKAWRSAFRNALKFCRNNELKINKVLSWRNLVMMTSSVFGGKLELKIEALKIAKKGDGVSF